MIEGSWQSSFPFPGMHHGTSDVWWHASVTSPTPALFLCAQLIKLVLTTTYAQQQCVLLGLQHICPPHSDLFPARAAHPPAACLCWCIDAEHEVVNLMCKSVHDHGLRFLAVVTSTVGSCRPPWGSYKAMRGCRAMRSCSAMRGCRLPWGLPLASSALCGS